MSLRERTRPGLGIIEPCLPSTAKVPPSGPGWLHEIKHDGFRILARRDRAGVRLFTRNANDFTDRFPFIATAVAELPVKSCLIDGEAIVCDENGLAVFDLIRRQGTGESAVLSAFDLLELDGKDLRRRPIETRKALLAKLLNGSHSSIVLNEYYEEDGAVVFQQACRLGCEGIVSKRLGSVYRRGRSPVWLKVKVHPHMLRHACGYALANRGHDTRALQAYLGHKNIQHTVRYTELSPLRFKDFWRT